MWNFLIQRSTKNAASGSNHDTGSPAKRRRPSPFAGAEPLETRALLSATGTDSPMNLFAINAGTNNSPPVAADISFVGDANSGSTQEKLAVEQTAGIADAPPDSLGVPHFSFGMSDSLFAAIAQSNPVQRTSGINFNDQQSSFADTSPGILEGSVEFRIADTGQVISVGSSAQFKDSSGLTVNDDGVSMTYRRTTDADGRAFSQLLFIIRSTRSAPDSQPKLPMESVGAVVADAELFSDSNSDELTVRPDLHDFATALDSANQELAASSQTSRSDDMLPSLAAATRTRWMNSTRISVSSERPASELKETSTSVRSTSIERMADDSDTDFSDLSAVPVFDPTTRNVVLSVGLLGTLARATARHRRRQKAVALAQGFAAQ